MFVPALLIGVVVVLIVGHFAPRMSPTAQVVSVIVIGYVLGFETWHARIGPLPLTLDRLALLGIASLTAWRWWSGRVSAAQPIVLDWVLGVLCGWLTLSYVLNRAPADLNLETTPGFRLIFSFWVPIALYALLRTTTIDGRAARHLMTGLACLGIYLGLTAILEVLQIWPLVFPRYIADPDLGTHFGRARGPALNSVSLGVHLSVCTAAAWLLIPRASRPMQLFWFGACVLMSLGVLLTFTRTTWLGLAGAAVTVICLQLPKPWRLAAFGATCLAGVLFLAVGKDAIVGLQREDSAEVSAHSAQQRLSFAYVSKQMFKDHPLLGVGYGRYYDKKLPYLNDRRQWFELESIRSLHHHNTFLSLLVETGLLGLTAFVAVLAGFGWVGWRLAHDAGVSDECNRLGLLLIGAVVNYFPSALGHDLTLIHSEQWMLFAIAGAAAGCWINQGETRKALAANEATELTAPWSPASFGTTPGFTRG